MWSGIAHASALDNFRLSRIASLTTTEIELGCAMRYLSHTPADGGVELRVRMELGFDCVNALRNTPNSLHRPQGGHLAFLSEVEFETVAVNQATITLRFGRPVSFEVSQTANLYLLTVTVDTSTAMPPAVPPPIIPPAPDSNDATTDRNARRQGPSRNVTRAEPSIRDRFAIRLSVYQTRDEINLDLLKLYPEFALYTNEVRMDTRKWLELRIGFFDTEAAAQAVLEEISIIFPSAWISIANPEEQVIAQRQRLTPGDDSARISVPEVAAAASSMNKDQASLPPDSVTVLMSDARSAILREDFDESIKIYTRLLEQPIGQHRAVAREFLGVARQKNGQLAHAKAEFEAYLKEFPTGEDARRVRQRLAALTDRAKRPAMAARNEAALQTEDAWEYYGGASQFYLRDVNLTRDDEADIVTQSALLSQADIFVSRRGERFDLLGRANFGYIYDFADNGVENQARVSYAYLDVIDNTRELSARLGRQTRHKGGVLGRFDGAHASYGLWPNIAVNITAGFPVDSPRYLASLDRYFYGASAEITNVADAWDFTVFTNLQTIDGISDRKGVGADVQYHSSRMNVVGLLDYDASYNVLNNGFLAGNWRLTDRLTISGRYQGGAGPFLTTRNAIIGQPVNTVEALFATYSEGQIRRLARNRTAEVRSGAAGLSAELTERWHLSADLVYNESGSTVASGGVEAFPETGPQIVYGGHLLGSSITKAGDSLIVGYRHFESRSTDSDTVFIDMRYPVGDGLRINPKLALTLQNRNVAPAGETQHWIANPMLRILFRGRSNYRIEFEIGGQWSNEEFPTGIVSPFAPDGSIESSAYYLQLGYWLDFR